MVAIKDMEMPSCCWGYKENGEDYECPLYHVCKNRDSFLVNNKPSDCPLVEIEEPKTGKWLGDKRYPICPKCNCNIIEEYISCSDYAEMYKPMKFCPNCGAYMRSEEEK